MKKLGLLLMPLMAISFLASCNNGSGGGGGGGGGGDEPKTLEEYSWEEINEISKSGKANETFKVGDTKTVKVNDIDHKVRIIDFNHDYSELPDEGDPDPKNVLGITFEFANVITDSDGAVTTDAACFNYDYRKSNLNKFLNSDENCIYSKLPEDLRKVIKQVDKKTGVSTDGGQNYTAVSFDGNEYPYPYLFSLAHDEMVNNETYVTEDEGSKYQYYIEHLNATDRIKRKVDDTGQQGEKYWFRSPYTLYNPAHSAVYCIDTDGDISGGTCTVRGDIDYLAVAPAFCI